MDSNISLAEILCLATKEGYRQKHASHKLREIWAIRVRLQLSDRVRDLALFNPAIDSKLRGCDLLKLRVTESPRAVRFSIVP